MTESTQECISGPNDFIGNLIDMTAKEDKELKIFIDENLFAMNSKPNNFEMIYGNINALKEMEPNQQLVVKARAKHFEETNDPSKYFPALIATIASILMVFTLVNSVTVNKTDFTNIIFYLTVILIIIMLYVASRMYSHAVKMRSTAVYFNSLVTNIKYNKQ